MERFSECFSDLADPRGTNAPHDLREILFIALLATLCGATSCCDMALFARSKEELPRSVLGLKFGLPSHDTFSRVFRMLDPKAFEKAFQRFMTVFFAHLKLQRAKGVIAIEGKALRCAYERGKSHMPALMVTAWGAQTRMALANVLAQDGGEAAKTLVPELDFPGLQAFAMIRSKRGKDKTVERDYLLSWHYRPSQLLAIVREHWGIENRLHWTLDVVLDEDLARNRKGNAPANLAIRRRLALNIASAHSDKKTSMRGKLKRAGWDHSFIFDMLANMRLPCPTRGGRVAFVGDGALGYGPGAFE